MPRIGETVVYTHRAGSPVSQSAAVVQQLHEDGRVDLLVLATPEIEQFHELGACEGLAEREWQAIPATETAGNQALTELAALRVKLAGLLT